MFEAQLPQASLLKKIIDSIKDLVNDAPFDCSENAICLQVRCLTWTFMRTCLFCNLVLDYSNYNPT